MTLHETEKLNYSDLALLKANALSQVEWWISFRSKHGVEVIETDANDFVESMIKRWNSIAYKLACLIDERECINP